MEQEITFIVFTRGRERLAQLDLMSRAMQQYHPDAGGFIIDEIDGFKQQLLDALSETDKPYICFLVDDLVWLNPIDADAFRRFKQYPFIATLSLRLHPGITYSYTKDKNIPQPKIHRDNIWMWDGEWSYWGYPMSLDGNIFRRVEIVPLLNALEYNNPNELEGQLAANPLYKSWMMCQDRPSVVGLPLNIVQTVCTNRHAGYDAKKFAKMYDDGKRLKIPEFDKMPNSCHVEVDVEWE